MKMINTMKIDFANQFLPNSPRDSLQMNKKGPKCNHAILKHREKKADDYF